MAYAPTVQAEAGFTHNSLRHYGEVLGEPRTDGLSHADVYAGLQAAIATLAASHRRAATGTGQYIDVAMAATLMGVNERVILYWTGRREFHCCDEPCRVPHLSVLAAGDAARRSGGRPSFATAAARRANFAELHRIVQNWILTFADIGALDAQLDEAKITFGEVRSLKQLSEMGVGRILGCGPGGLRPQRRQLSPAWPPLALLARTAGTTRRARLSG